MIFLFLNYYLQAKQREESAYHAAVCTDEDCRLWTVLCD